MNKVMDGTLMGQRSRLAAATLAYNQKERTTLGMSPESIWRLLRPQESRWKNLKVREVAGKACAISDAEWFAYLDAKQCDAETLREKASRLQSLVEPVRQAIHSKTLRQKMKRQMNWLRRKQASSALPLLAGDICIARNTQYVSKCGPHKYETGSAGVRTFVVLQTKQGFAELKDLQTQLISWKHCANLKHMPRSVPAEPLPNSPARNKRGAEAVPFDVVDAATDGACLFRSLHMAQQLHSGVPMKSLVDSKEGAFSLRSQLLQQLQLLVETSDAAQLANLQEQIVVEMQDDPTWMASMGRAPWKWQNYFHYMQQPHTFGTAIFLRLFLDKHGGKIHLYNAGGDQNRSMEAEAKTPGKEIYLKQCNNHYDLLVLRRLRRKTHV